MNASLITRNTNRLKVGFLLWALSGSALYAFSGQAFLTVYINHIILFAMFVLMPMGLEILLERRVCCQPVLSVANTVQLPFALITVVSMMLPTGTNAELLSLPWVLLTAMISLSGLIYLWSNRQKITLSLVCYAVAQTFIIVGGMWLYMSRAGLNGLEPYVFIDEIVLLTALHFHFAGFTTTLIAGEVGTTMSIDTVTMKWLYRYLVLGVTIGTPIIALGITFDPFLALIGVTLLSTSLLGLAWMLFTQEFKGFSKTQKELLMLGGGTLLVSMPLAVLYSYGQLLGEDTVTIPFMAYTHGVLNCFGFAFCTLYGFYQKKFKGEL